MRTGGRLNIRAFMTPVTPTVVPPWLQIFGDKISAHLASIWRRNRKLNSWFQHPGMMPAARSVSSVGGEEATISLHSAKGDTFLSFWHGT